MSHLLSSSDTRSALITTLGADFQTVVAPFKAELFETAQHLQGDLHRAAMRLLVERHGRRPSAIEQQLIVAALAELQETMIPPTDILARVADRLNRYCDGAAMPRTPRTGNAS